MTPVTSLLLLLAFFGGYVCGAQTSTPPKDSEGKRHPQTEGQVAAEMALFGALIAALIAVGIWWVAS